MTLAASGTGAIEVDKRHNNSLLEGRFVGFCMVAGPLLLVVASVLVLDIYTNDTEAMLAEMSDQSTRARIGVNLSSAGSLLSVFAVLGVGHLVTRHGGRGGHASTWLAAVGLLGPVFFLGFVHMALVMAGESDHAGLARVLDEAWANPNVMNVAGPAIVLGFPWLAIAAARSGLLPKWRAVALGLTLIAPAGLIGGVPIIFFLGWVGLMLAVVPLGLSLFRGRS